MIVRWLRSGTASRIQADEWEYLHERIKTVGFEIGDLLSELMTSHRESWKSMKKMSQLWTAATCDHHTRTECT